MSWRDHFTVSENAPVDPYGQNGQNLLPCTLGKNEAGGFGHMCPRIEFSQSTPAAGRCCRERGFGHFSHFGHSGQRIEFSQSTPAQDARATTKGRFFRFYSSLAEAHGRDAWQRLCAMPGWQSRLYELERRFTDVWLAGGDPRGEFEALQEHWQTGLKGESDATLQA
jgi:hypothetical protein